MNTKTHSTSADSMLFAAVVAAFLSLCCDDALAGPDTRRNLPKCDPKSEDCGCSCKQVSADCIKVNIGLGETTPWTGAMPCALKIMADDDSPSIFTAESLHAVLGGYTFKRIGQKTMPDGVTPAEVLFSHPNGETVYFVFANGESLGRPDPGVHIKMDARLQMVDSEGWATTHDPVYYDLYVGDGTKRRFLATNMTGALGALVSITGARGKTITPADMGVDIVYDSVGVRQYLTPSRLANVTRTADFLGYDVAVYALQEQPQKDAATGLYVVPAGQTVEHVSIRRENDGKRAIVTIRKGGGDPLRYVFDYAMREWSLTMPSGLEERKECFIDDERAAQVNKTDVSPSGEVLAKKVKNYKWESWGFAMTNRVEGFGGVTDTTTWTYYTSGNGKGQVKTEQHQSGLLIQYAYDNLDRVTSETRSGPDMMTEVTTYDYTPVDANDPVLPVDTRPRTVVRKLNNIECERTYYVYSPLTNIVERVGTQGAAYGGTNVLRTVMAFYPVVVNDPRSGFVQSIRHEDGRLDLYDYVLVSNLWTKTVTHLHEQSPLPVSGKTTRDITTANRRGEVIEEKTEAFIDGIWYTIARNQMTYNFEGKRITSENLAGQVTTTAWDCCHKVSEVQSDGSTTTWDYDMEGRVVASSRLIPLDMTNVTWLTTCDRYDDLGRQVATWQTNYSAQVGLPAICTRYDALSHVIARVDPLGNTTTTEYSPDGRTVSVHNPNTSIRVITRSADGDTLSITGTAVTPEFHSYGILPDGTHWSKTVKGETANSPRFTKRYENMLGQTIREERSGFQGAVLSTTHTYDSYGRLVSTSADYEPATEYTYDTLGNRVATTRSVVIGTTGVLPVEWRKTETLSSFVLGDAIVWFTQTNIVSCSDAAIVPLVTSTSRQLTGLTAALPARSRTTDIRRNITENETLVDAPFVTSRQTVPYATNKPLSLSRYGVSLMDVSVSAVTNSVAYDCLGRQISAIDGRGNTRHTEFNAFGQRSASIDAFGNRTTYAYDQFGNLASVTDPLGNATVYECDLRGRKTYEGGATYPVRYTYDVFGNKTTMMTYRNESLGPDSGDVTTWLYDEASGAMTNKVYADGKGPTYSYTLDGKLSRRIWARGIITDYLYDSWGNQTNIVYSDNTPTVTFAYDALGRQTEAHDAAGVTTFLYDAFGSLTNETVIGVAGTNTIERFYDNFGRDAGYSLNGVRQSTLAYDPVTGRLASMQVPRQDNSNTSPTPTNTSNSFAWSYLPGSDLKSALTYPNGLTASWQYDANNQLLQVRNATSTNVISQYDYIYDAAGRRISRAQSGSAFIHPDIITYGYNIRSELTDAMAAVDSDYRYAYDYDDIGNRKTAVERGTNIVYATNQLNQYSSVDDFSPLFDDDGNQTLIQTSTGTWLVQYNAENRPVFWSNGESNVMMSFDRMGRRIQYLETSSCGNGSTRTNANWSFVYNGYLCAKRLNVFCGNTADTFFVWNPADTLSPRLLMVEKYDGDKFFVMHDGNKNASDITSMPGDSGLQGHYEYTPFGSPMFSSLNTSIAGIDFYFYNPFQFSSEYADDTLGLHYYNFRHYDYTSGRMTSVEPLAMIPRLRYDTLLDYSLIVANVYRFVANHPISSFDHLGREQKSGTEVGRTEIDKPWWMSNWLLWPFVIPNPDDVYGNYCGACRINGRFFDGDGQQGWKSEEIGEGRRYYYYDGKTGEKKFGNAPWPIDEYDRCCMEHDRCLADVENMVASIDEKAKKTKICDAQLSLCWFKAYAGLNFSIEARVKATTAMPVMAVVAHPSATASIVSDVSGDVAEDVWTGIRGVTGFLGQGMKNAMMDSNNDKCCGSCQFKWSLGW